MLRVVANLSLTSAERQKIKRIRIKGGRRLKDRQKLPCLHPGPTRVKRHGGCNSFRCGYSRGHNERGTVCGAGAGRIATLERRRPRSTRLRALRWGTRNLG